MSALYRKYRPQLFADIIGQEPIKMTLENEISRGSIAHAYMFAGPRAVGKTTTARVFARAINCIKRKTGVPEPCNECEPCLSILEHRSLDIIEIDAASNTGVDNVRDNIIATAKVAHTQLTNKVFIIDEVHMLSISAFNALLKLIEEPPSHVVFILATTELHKVPPTIISRCERFDFKKIPAKQMFARLMLIAKKEKKSVEKEVINEIVRLSQGCQRDAESLLGQIFSLGDTITYDFASALLPRTDHVAVRRLADAISHKRNEQALAIVQELIDNGVDLDVFVGDMIEYLRNIMLYKNNVTNLVDTDETTEKSLTELATLLSMRDILALVSHWMAAQKDARWFSLPQLPIEVAIVKGCIRE
ncbi:MAG: DNA polymerase III subunit gamma/tau [bacterium]|nr:DNA polymerase III subunit gamma/tau [bacterium]